MACSTCDDYCYIPNNDDGGGALVECPDCHSEAVRAWCPVHSVRLDERGSCRKCSAEAAHGIATILGTRAAETAKAAKVVETA